MCGGSRGGSAESNRQCFGYGGGHRKHTNTNSVNSFDSENKPFILEGIAVLYDALGRAAEAAEPSGPEEFLYGPAGGKIAVMAGQSLARADIPLPGGGEAVYEAGGLTAYRHADQLGSAPLASTPAQTVWSAVGYAPYGEPFSSTGSDRSFTGKKSDINGDQYDFLMREYNPTQGRWWTPDPAGLAAVDPGNPQSWNRYAYTNGTPLNSVDPFGLAAQQPCFDGGVCNWDPVGCTIDGMDVGCNEAQQQAGMLGGGGIAICPQNWCTGQHATNGYGGAAMFPQQPRFSLVPVASICTGVTGADGTVSDPDCTVYLRGVWSRGILAAGTLAQTEISMAPIGQQDAGPVRDLVVGFAKLVHPLEVAAVNATFFFVSGASFAAAYMAPVAGCADPLPIEPLTCAAGIGAGVMYGAIGAGSLAGGVWFFRNVTVPAFREWGGGG